MIIYLKALRAFADNFKKTESTYPSIDRYAL